MFTACADDGFIGDKTALEGAEGEKPISFGSATPATTRADKVDGAAATDLNNNFVVFGYKTMTGPTTQTVFQNYQANYVTNTAHTTTSNSANWEYVGYKNLPVGVSTDVGVTAFSALTGSGQANETAIDQTIKYWDYSATNYKFFAYSLGTGKSGPTYAKASALTNSPSDSYTLEGDQDQLASCYISELLTIDDPDGSTPTEVDLRFLSIKSKLQLGFYETIPGYSVKNLKFYATSAAGSSTTTPALYAGSSTLPKAGTYTVTFDSNGKPLLAWEAAASDGSQENVTFETTLTDYETPEYKEASADYLGRASNEATKTAVKDVLPYADGADLTLKVDYTLVSRDGTGETIEAVGATAVVPAAFTKWKPNYKYTYLFKISDKSNPLIGGVAGLYPITLDAVVASEQDGSQETITTVSEPSITTYAKASAVLTNDEYVTGNNIYAVVEDAALDPSNPTLTVGTNAKLYFVTLESDAAQTITEASVANALVNGTNNTTDKTRTVTDASGKKMVVTDTEDYLLTTITQILAADSPTGVDLSVKGAKFTPQAKYVVVPNGTALTEGVTYYTSDAGAGGAVAGADETSDGSKYRKVSDATGAYVIEYSRAQVSYPYIAATGTYVNGTTYYTDGTGTTPVDTTGFEEGVTDVTSYFVADPSYIPATKVYKVIKVIEAAP